MMNRRMLLKAGIAAGLGLCHGVVNAQRSGWPSREIKVILPVAAGGANDLLARAVFAQVGKLLEVPFVIMNVPGGNATRGTIMLANSKNDGYVIGNIAYSALLLQPHMVSVPYKLSDFDMLGSAGEPLYGLGVPAASSLQSVGDVVKLAKTRRVTVTSNTIINMVCMMQLRTMTGCDLQWVPTSSQAQAVTLAAGGFADCTLQSAPELNAAIDGGKIRLVAAANAVRWPNRAEVKTFIEQGYATANSVPLGYGAPVGVDPGIRRELEGAILQASQSPEVTDAMAAIGVVPRLLDAAGLAEAFRKAAPVLERVLADAGMKKI